MKITTQRPSLLLLVAFSLTGSFCWSTNLCQLGAQVHSASEHAWRKAYLGILEDSRHVLFVESLQQALKQKAPFRIDGDGPLFPETRAALEVLEKHFRKSGLPGVEEKLLAELEDFLSTDVPEYEIIAHRMRTGFSDPLKVIHAFPTTSQRIVAGGYSLDGNLVLTVSQQGEVRAYHRGKDLTLHYATDPLVPDGSGWQHWSARLDLFPIQFSRDGKWMAFIGRGSSEHFGPHVFEVATGNYQPNFPSIDLSHTVRFPGKTGSLLFSPKCDQIAFNDMDDASVAFSRNGRFCFSGSKISPLEIFDKKIGKKVALNASHPLHHLYSRPVAHPLKPWLILQDDLISRHEELALYDYDRTPPSEPELIYSSARRNWRNIMWGGVLFSPKGDFLVSHYYEPDNTGVSSTQVFHFGTKLPKELVQAADLSKHLFGRVRKMEFSPDGKYFFAIDSKRRLRVFTVPDFALFASAGSPEEPIWDFALSPDLRRIFTIELDAIARERNFILSANEEVRR